MRYFDTHAHGDIMSVYTNDVDTLRQLISQGIPQIINSLLTLVTALVAMFVLSVPLSLLTVAVMVGMVLVTGVIADEGRPLFPGPAAGPGRGRRLHRGDDGRAEGGQGLLPRGAGPGGLPPAQPEALRDRADKANAFGNITMPVNANLGNISYVLCAVVGAPLRPGRSLPA